MEKLNQCSIAVVAEYTPQKIRRFQGNQLIEALPPCMPDEQLAEWLFQLPDFDQGQRDWDTHDRLQQVAGLAHFMLPMPRHIQLARTLDTLIREGYAGRAPRTAEHVRIFQQLYENQKAGRAFSAGIATSQPQLSTSLVGLSGMGKTTTVRRVLAATPPVIYHTNLHFYQITYLHVETPYDGASVKGLAHSILRKVDSLIPDAGYFERYANKGNPGAETLMNHVARVLNMHCTGLLVMDEIQNLSNAGKSKQSLMTLLVSAANELGVPLLLIGTNKARRVLGLDLRQARRSIGQGLSYWDRLEQGTPEHPGEWDDFLPILWKFQWIRKPVELNPFLSGLMYHHSQGVIDIAVKLFAAAQWRAMLDETETITPQLIESVANKELSLVRPMVEALRKQDVAALELYDDIAPIEFENMLRDVKSQFEGKRVRGASVKPGDRLFAPSVSAALTALGVASDEAERLAQTVEKEDQPANVLEGASKALFRLRPPAARKGSKSQFETPANLPPHDLRNAILQAAQHGTPIYDRLKEMHAVCELDKVLNLG